MKTSNDFMLGLFTNVLFVSFFCIFVFCLFSVITGFVLTKEQRKNNLFLKALWDFDRLAIPLILVTVVSFIGSIGITAGLYDSGNYEVGNGAYIFIPTFLIMLYLYFQPRIGEKREIKTRYKKKVNEYNFLIDQSIITVSKYDYYEGKTKNTIDKLLHELNQLKVLMQSEDQKKLSIIEMKNSIERMDFRVENKRRAVMDIYDNYKEMESTVYYQLKNMELKGTSEQDEKWYQIVKETVKSDPFLIYDLLNEKTANNDLITLKNII